MHLGIQSSLTFSTVLLLKIFQGIILKMKAVFALALATVCILVLCNDAHASPSDMDKAKDTKAKDATTVKDVKAQKDAKKKCARTCPTVRDQICAHDPTNPTLKPKMFETPCAMEVENCEMGTKYVVKNKGQCI